jgi:hypothetical protein
LNSRITIRLEPCARTLWTQFAKYHYFDTPLNKASRTFLAIAVVKGEEEFPIGFCASLAAPSGTMKNVFRAHKTVVSLPETHPHEKELWRLVSDAQAALHINEGKRFMSMAPIRYAIYRDDPLSGWMPTTANKRRKLAGYCSHEYIGSDDALARHVAQLVLAGYQGIHNQPTADGFLNWRGKKILRVRVTSIINGKDAWSRRRAFWFALSELVWSAGWEGNNVIARGCREAYIFRQYDPTHPKRPKEMPDDWEPVTDMSNAGGRGGWDEDGEYARGLVPLPPWRVDKRLTVKQRIARTTERY